MEPNVSMRDYVDKADEAVESRLTQKLDRLSTKGTVWGAVATGAALLLAVLAFGGDRFDSGLAVSPAMTEVRDSQAVTDRKQDAKLDRLDDKLDILISRTNAPTGR